MSDLRLGELEVLDVRVGTTPAKAVMLGTTKVWPPAPIEAILVEGTWDTDYSSTVPSSGKVRPYTDQVRLHYTDKDGTNYRDLLRYALAIDYDRITVTGIATNVDALVDSTSFYSSYGRFYSSTISSGDFVSGLSGPMTVRMIRDLTRRLPSDYRTDQYWLKVAGSLPSSGRFTQPNGYYVRLSGTDFYGVPMSGFLESILAPDHPWQLSVDEGSSWQNIDSMDRSTLPAYCTIALRDEAPIASNNNADVVEFRRTPFT